MKTAIKAMWKTLGFNFGGGLVLFIISLAAGGSVADATGALGAGVCIALFVEFLAGIFFVSTGKRRETGKGILMAVGIIVLLGFVVCTGTFLRSLNH